MPRHVHDKPFTVRFINKVNEKRASTRQQKENNLLHRWYQDKYSTGVGCMVTVQSRTLASAMANTQQYSRQKCRPSSYAQWRI